MRCCDVRHVASYIAAYALLRRETRRLLHCCLCAVAGGNAVPPLRCHLCAMNTTLSAMGGSFDAVMKQYAGNMEQSDDLTLLVIRRS